MAEEQEKLRADKSPDPRSPHTAICSRKLHTLTPDDSVGDAIKLMSDQAIRRVLIVDADKPVGIVSLGDLAVTQDRDSALADISAAPPNE